MGHHLFVMEAERGDEHLYIYNITLISHTSPVHTCVHNYSTGTTPIHIATVRNNYGVTSYTYSLINKNSQSIMMCMRDIEQ